MMQEVATLFVKQHEKYQLSVIKDGGKSINIPNICLNLKPNLKTLEILKQA
jgi:hypothetical protein